MTRFLSSWAVLTKNNSLMASSWSAEVDFTPICIFLYKFIKQIQTLQILTTLLGIFKVNQTWEFHTNWNTLTLTVHSPTKSNKGKWRKCAKSDYIIEAGLIWERNRCPGSDTPVACHGCTVHCGAGGLRFETQGGNPHFWTPPFPRR